MQALIAALLLAGSAPVRHELAGDVVGEISRHVVERGESLIEIARLYDVGYLAIASANPGVDPFVPEPGRTVIVPTRWIVPRGAARGVILLNLSEMRLYLTRRPPALAVTFPVGIGDEGWETPTGTFRVIAKHVAPTWYPPASIRAEDPELPAAVPPGPDNPLGTHALRLSRPTILIHGTDKPFGVGRRVSHGCIRLYPEDIPRLFEIVPVDTEVRIVREPVKVGVLDGRPYLEIHDDPDAHVEYAAEATRLLAERGLLDRADPAKVAAVAAERSGIPEDVGRNAAAAAP